MTRHLLVSNDFPPKVGGIQSYLWELWRRLEPDDVMVYTTPYSGAASFDAAQRYRIERSPERWLGPFPHLIKRINSLAAEHKAELIVVDPAVPLGMIAPHFELPYAVVIHGAEVTVPARLPVTRRALRRVLEHAEFVISAGQYALDEAEKCVGRPLSAVVIPPGVDAKRFRPFTSAERSSARAKFGLADDDVVLATVNRLVPRKGMHRLIEAVAAVSKSHNQLKLLIGGTGRESKRLEALVDSLGAPVRLLGRISDDEVAQLYGAADIMAMLCADRWGGLEAEGFGIVFLEAAAAGLPQIAGRSGGAAEAVIHGLTGFVVDPTNEVEVIRALEDLVTKPELRQRLGDQARERAVAEFDYDIASQKLAAALAGLVGAKSPLI